MNALEKYVTKVKLAQALKAKKHSKADLVGAAGTAVRRGMNFRMDPAKTLKPGPMVQKFKSPLSLGGTTKSPAELKALLSDPKKRSAAHMISKAINRGMEVKDP